MVGSNDPVTIKPTPIQYLGPLFRPCRIEQGLTCDHVCNRLRERDVDLSPGQLLAIEQETVLGPVPAMNALNMVIGSTLARIEERLAEVERSWN